MPGREVESTLGRHTKQLFCLTHHEQFPYAFIGSASAVRLGGRCFVVWCRHQTKDYRPDDVTIPIESGKTLISGSPYLFIEPDDSNIGEDFLDLCAAEYAPDNYHSQNLEASFFPLRENECWDGNPHAQFFLFGYPTNLRIVEYNVPHVHTRQIVTSAQYACASHSRGIHRIKMTRTTQFGSDGLSGGPVYHLTRGKSGYFIGFAGMIMRGSDASEYIHFLEARLIVSLLDSHIRTWSATHGQGQLGERMGKAPSG